MGNKNTTQQLQQVLVEEAKRRATEPQGSRLTGMIERLEQEGKIVKGEYSLPPMDTIGRRMHGELRSQADKGE